MKLFEILLFIISLITIIVLWLYNLRLRRKLKQMESIKSEEFKQVLEQFTKIFIIPNKNKDEDLIEVTMKEEKEENKNKND